MGNDTSYQLTNHDAPDAARGSLRGNLADISVSQLLSLINIAKKTGVLRFFKPRTTRDFFGFGAGRGSKIVPGDERAVIWFQDGNILKTSIGRSNGHLVDILHKAYKIDDEQAALIRDWTRTYSEKALAMRVINANYVSHTDMVTTVAQHMLDHICEIMAWSEEFFAFEEGAAPPEDVLTITLDTRQAVKESTLRTHEIRQLKMALPNLEFSLAFTDSPEEKLRGVQLSIDEWRVMSYVNPDLSVGQIAAICHMTEAQIRKIVFRLVDAGLVKLLEPAKGRRSRRRTQALPKVEPDEIWPPGKPRNGLHQ